MRVTNAMIVNNFISNMNTSLTKLDKLQNQMSMTAHSNFAHISDDPVAVIYSQQARYKLDRLAQYQQSVNTASGWLRQAESTLMDINEVLQGARESCVSMTTDAKTASDRQKTAQYIGQLRDHVLATLNATFGDKFVFGAYNTTGYSDADGATPPFNVTPDNELTYNNNLTLNNAVLTDPANAADIERIMKDVLAFDLGLGIGMAVTLNGINVATFQSTVDNKMVNLYNLLDDLYNQLNKEGGEFSGPVTALTAGGSPISVSGITGISLNVPSYFGERLNGVSFNAGDLRIVSGPDNAAVFELDLGAAGVFTSDPTDLNNFTSGGGEILLKNASGDFISLYLTGNYDAGNPAAFAALGSDLGAVAGGFDGGNESVNTGIEITPFITRIQEAQDHILALTAEIGGKAKRIELLEARYEQDEINYTQMKSDAEDADEAELIMRYKMAETVYKAALSTGASIIQPTLMDFLR